MLASYRSREAGDFEAADAVAASHDGPVASALRRWYHRADASRQTHQPAGEAQPVKTSNRHPNVGGVGAMRESHRLAE